MKVDGTFYEDPFFDKHKAKYESIRHCREWLDQIQAKTINRVKKTIDKDMETIEDKFKKLYGSNLHYNKDKKNIIPCAEFRIVIKDLSLTWYNNHIPYVRKIITGYIPIQLTSKEERVILKDFVVVERTFEIIVEETHDDDGKKPNMRYYPFFIYKIMEIRIIDERKLHSLLECIHMQSEDTLKKHDMVWKKICDIEPIFHGKFIPTDRNRRLNL
jgi:hypothetical protein